MLKITALNYISLSEIQKVRPEINSEWISNNPDSFREMLYDLGTDVSIPYEHQVNIQHRNRFNEIVKCDRWVGNERTDEDWIKSGLASREAKDKASGSRLVVDLYRMKGLVDIE